MLVMARANRARLPTRSAVTCDMRSAELWKTYVRHPWRAMRVCENVNSVCCCCALDKVVEWWQRAGSSITG